jgi:hypothetical protein
MGMEVRAVPIAVHSQIVPRFGGVSRGQVRRVAVRADSAAKACAERVEVVYSEVSEAVDEQRRLIGDAEVCAAVHHS